MPVWLPYVRGERTPFDDHTLRSNLYGIDIASGPEALERAAFEASGFVIRRIIDRAGVPTRRIVASGGGSRVTAWMAAVADATDLPVDALTVPDGAARGAAFSPAWRPDWRPRSTTRLVGPAIGRRIEPDPTWAGPRRSRYSRFCELGDRRVAVASRLSRWG